MLKVKQCMNILTYEICKKISIYHLVLHKIEYKIVKFVNLKIYNIQLAYIHVF